MAGIMAWISVDDELPKSHESVLIAAHYTHNKAGYEVMEGCCYRVTTTDEGEQVRWISDGWTITGVTHWMPLPEPPELPEVES